MRPAANDYEPPPIRREPWSPDLPRFGQLFFEAVELARKVEIELELAPPRGRRRDLLVRAAVATRRLIPILGGADSSWHHGQSAQRTGNYLKSHNNFAFDRCTVAMLEESASPRVGISRALKPLAGID
jgi:hypothetical protein